MFPKISKEGFRRLGQEGSDTLYYHISNEFFDRFDNQMGVGSQMWFGMTPPDESNQYYGAGLYPNKVKYIYTVHLNFTNPAGWDEYDRLALDQIIAEGYDAVKLDDTIIVFDEDIIDIVEVSQV